MTDYLTEQEQIQQLKNWLKQYGPTIIAGIVLALAITSGWHYWQNYRNTILTRASMAYDLLLNAKVQGDTEQTQAKATQLIKQYGDTPYASAAAMTLAQEAVAKKNYADAIKQLNWVLSHSEDQSMKEIARTRIARVLIAQDKPQEALNILKKIDDKNFMGLINEVRGDAYLALKNTTAARQAYQLALQAQPNGHASRPLLQIKYDNLAQ